jgi:hypothetical protein
MIERQTLRLSTGTKGIADCEAKLDSDIKSYSALVAQKDSYKAYLLDIKQSLTTTSKGEAVRSIGHVNKTCKSLIQADKERCTQAKVYACNEIKTNFLTKVTEYNNELLPGYKDDAEYKNFRAYDITGLETLKPEEIIGEYNLKSIDCALTTP